MQCSSWTDGRAACVGHNNPQTQGQTLLKVQLPPAEVSHAPLPFATAQYVNCFPGPEACNHLLLAVPCLLTKCTQQQAGIAPTADWPSEPHDLLGQGWSSPHSFGSV
jgi:hypothetical protein